MTLTQLYQKLSISYNTTYEKDNHCHTSKTYQEDPIDYYNHMMLPWHTNHLKPSIKPKDPVTQGRRTGVIYNIEWKYCNSHCVGKTGRRLAECIFEHQLRIRRYNENLIQQHIDKLNQTQLWTNWETSSFQLNPKLLGNS